MKVLCLLALCSTVFAALKEVEVNQDIFIENGAGHSTAHGMGNQLKLVSEMKLPNGVVKQKYEQYFNGVAVSSTAVVTTKTDKGSEDAQGIMYEIDDSQGIMSLTTISKEESLEIAKNQFMIDNNLAKLDVANEEVKLMIDPKHGEVYKVNFLVEMDDKPPHRPFYKIDASSGEIKEEWEGLDTENGGGPGGNKRTKKYMYGAGTKLGPLDVKRSAGGYCYLENKNVKTVNMNHATSLPGNPAHKFWCPDNSHKEINGAYSPLNDAHYFGGLLYKMFNDWAGIPPLNFQLVLRVHYKHNYQNAFWDGSVMTFGDGGSTFYPMIDINVVTHEAAHGFTGQNSGLEYKGESGGMNEAYSDIAGESAEAYARKNVDWMVGADIFKQSGAAMRYFQRPEKDGRSIGHANKFYDGMDVHHSSGVYNRAYYLIVNSGKYTFKQAFILFTTANKLYWTASSSFDQGACGVESAARDLVYDVAVVKSSFATVGVSCKGKGGSCRNLYVGSSKYRTKTVTIPAKYICPTAFVHKGDTYKVEQKGDKVTVTRTDRPQGWGLQLKFQCCATKNPVLCGEIRKGGCSMSYILRKTAKTEQSCRQLCEQTTGCAVFFHVNEKNRRWCMSSTQGRCSQL